MARVRVKLPPHDCQPPEMFEREVVHYHPRNLLDRLLDRDRASWTETIYKARDAFWTCPECNCEWRFGWIFTGTWTPWTPREEKWEEREI